MCRMGLLSQYCISLHKTTPTIAHTFHPKLRYAYVRGRKWKCVQLSIDMINHVKIMRPQPFYQGRLCAKENKLFLLCSFFFHCRYDVEKVYVNLCYISGSSCQCMQMLSQSQRILIVARRKEAISTGSIYSFLLEKNLFIERWIKYSSFYTSKAITPLSSVRLLVGATNP